MPRQRSIPMPPPRDDSPSLAELAEGVSGKPPLFPTEPPAPARIVESKASAEAPPPEAPPATNLPRWETKKPEGMPLMAWYAGMVVIGLSTPLLVNGAVETPPATETAEIAWEIAEAMVVQYDLRQARGDF